MARSTDPLFDTFCAPGTTWGPSPGVREAWAAGRRRYAVWLLRVQPPAVLERMKRVAEALGDAVEPTPLCDAHITLWVAGFPTDTPRLDDDVSEAVLAAQAEALEAHFGGRGPVRVEVGGANAFFTCAVLDVFDPDSALAEIRACLDEEGRELRFGPYHPHVTAGRFIDSRDRAPLAQALRPLRDLPLLPLDVHAVELCTFDAQAEALHLTTTARVLLTDRPR
jgi:2'-5' RNA ligase